MSPWRANEEMPVDFTKLLYQYQIEEERDCEDFKEDFEVEMQQFIEQSSAQPRCSRPRAMYEARVRTRAPVTPSNASSPRLSPAVISPVGDAILPISAVDGRLTPPGDDPASYATLTPITTVPDKSSDAGLTAIQQQSYAALSLAAYDEPSSPQSAYITLCASPNSSERLSPTPSPVLDLNAALLAREEQRQQKHKRDEIEKHAQNDTEEINTKELVQRISRELKRCSIPQAIFAQRVLQRKQGTLSDLLNRPKPWSKLKRGRETFVKMWKWLQKPEPQRMSALGLADISNFKTSRSRPTSSRDKSTINSHI